MGKDKHAKLSYACGTLLNKAKSKYLDINAADVTKATDSDVIEAALEFYLRKR